jgi:thymidylate synthase
MQDRFFRLQYEELLMRLLNRGHVETNRRTGVRVAVGEPTSFSLDLSDGRLPVCGIRRMFPRTAAAEVAWFLQGFQHVGFIKGYAPIWDKFVEDDGTTIEAAYGYRWRDHFGRDQIENAIHCLTVDPSDRRVFVSAWDPAQDGLGRPAKNVPCPVGFTLSITAGQLNSSLLIRSSDVFVGLPYDVMGHALLMQAVRHSIGGELGLGTMHVTLAHPHVYERHWSMANLALAAKPCDETIVMPDWDVQLIEADPHGYVAEVARRAKAHEQPDFHCRPEVVQ